MNELIVMTLFVMKLRESITPQNITATIAVLTAAFAVIASFVTWRIDRGRLKKSEENIKRMENNFQKHVEDNNKEFKEFRTEIKNSNQQVIDKVDELKMYLLHSKITIKGEKRNE